VAGSKSPLVKEAGSKLERYDFRGAAELELEAIKFQEMPYVEAEV